MEIFSLDEPLLSFAENNTWTVRNAVEGVQIFGGIGSGKTSGSGYRLAKKYLQMGFGGLVLTVKSDEYRANWCQYAETCGRLDDVIHIRPGGEYRFNFLNYELTRSGAGAGLVDNLVNTLKTVIRAGQDTRSSNGDAFWDDALDMLLFNVIDLCYLAYGSEFNLDQLFAVAESLPKDIDRLKQDNSARDLNPFYQAYLKAKKATIAKVQESKRAFEAETDQPYNQQADRNWQKFSKIMYYFSNTYADLNPKTRSIIEHSFSGLLFRLNRDPIYSLLCSPDPNITPEMCLEGKIIVFDLPVKQFDKIGRDAQILFKYIWQRSMERRDITHNNRPVFLWADEAQNFLHEHDIDYQATARSSRICTVYLTQNLPNYYAHMGGREGEFRVKSFLGTMGTKIFHANADVDTNRYASELFGKAYLEDRSHTSGFSDDMNMSMTKSYRLEDLVRPEQFVRLKTGGDHNKKQVEAYIHKQGIPWVSYGDNNAPQVRNYWKLNFLQP